MQPNQPSSTFLLVLSILAIVLGIALFEYGHAWLFHRSPPPFVSAVVAVVVAVVVVALRVKRKRL